MNPSLHRSLSRGSYADAVPLPTFYGVQVVRLVEKEIRISPMKLGLVAKLVRGLTVRQAVAQLMFSKKKHAKVGINMCTATSQPALADSNR